MSERPDFRRYLRDHLAGLSPYQGVETVESLAARYGLPMEAISKLDANENPYGPSPLVYEALASLRDTHRYPDPLASELRGRVAGYAGVDVSQVLVGAGSDELLELLVRLFVEPGEAVIDSQPTFSMYSAFTRQHGGKMIDVPRAGDWSLDVLGILAAVGSGVKLIFVCSPNNPTGNLTSEEDLLTLLGAGLPVVVDEAYYEFAGRSCVQLLGEWPNLVVLRTFSKLAGLAGLRVGYMLAHADLIQEALKLKQPYNVSVAGQAAALASLDDLDWLRGNVRRLVEERDRMASLLRADGRLEPYPSDANFILCRVSGDARELRERLARRGVFVRHFGKPRIEVCVRISAGRPEDTDRLTEALAGLPRLAEVGA